MKNHIWSIALIAFIAFTAFSCEKDDPVTPETEQDVYKPGDKVEIRHEVRAAWLTTVGGYDWPSGERNATKQQKSLVELIAKLKALGCNTVFFQVTCNSDAMWPSDILPWSPDLTGTVGKDPGYDPLALAVETCHKEGLEIHAWINPLRVGNEAKAKANPLFEQYSDQIRCYTPTGGAKTWYWDPGYPQIKERIASVVKELLTNYDLDGIHIDDYFYPSGLQSSTNDWDDSDSYAKYGNGVPLDEWRYSNVNAVVEAMYKATHETKPTAIYGVSPAGRLVNTRALYADPEQWTKAGIVDYLAPQIYWQHGHKVADFTTVLHTWYDVLNGAYCIPGLAIYRYGETGFESLNEFDRQVNELRTSRYVQGHIWFRCKVKLLEDDVYSFIKTRLYKYPSLVPDFRKVKGSTPITPDLSVDGSTISWFECIPDADKEACPNHYGYAVYELYKKDNVWYGNYVSDQKKLSYKGKTGKSYVVVAYCGKSNSAVSNVVTL